MEENRDGNNHIKGWENSLGEADNVGLCHTQNIHYVGKSVYVCVYVYICVHVYNETIKQIIREE